MDIVNISLLDVTGPLDDDTPYIVLQEIAEVHNINLENERRALFSTESTKEFREKGISLRIASLVEPYTFHRPLHIKDLPAASIFVNRGVLWTIESLNSAMNFIIFFSKHPGFPPDGNVIYGKPVPYRPTSFTACMLYRLLKDRNVKIHKYCTLRHLAEAVTISYRSPEQSRSLVYSSIIHILNPDQLVNMYTNYVNMIDPSPPFSVHSSSVNNQRLQETNFRTGLLNSDMRTFSFSSYSSDDADNYYEDEENYNDNGIVETLLDNVDEKPPEFFNSISAVSYGKLKDVYELFTDQTYVLQRIIPVTPSEAICLAAINFEFDLSAARDPIKEYKVLVNDPISYIPQDEILKQYYDINPYLIRLDIHFNPLLPPELYDENCINRLAKFEGYTNHDFREENPYSLLQTAFYSDSFHEGKHRLLKNEDTLEGESVNELPSSLVVCFGQLDQGVHAFRYRELEKIFRIERCFKNPIENTIFSDNIIRKLKNICSFIHPGELLTHFSERTNLLNTINYVELINTKEYGKLREFHDIFHILNEDKKNSIRICVSMLMDMGFYMRGWNGIDDYPVEYCPVENQNEVDVNVTQAIARFETKCNELNSLLDDVDLGHILLNLPLFKYDNGTYIISNNIIEGTTIGERIYIVKEGEDADTVSCIRLSSNWICCTAYRIMQTLGMIPQFDIEKLRYIS